jgi:hypothetical protein
MATARNDMTGPSLAQAPAGDYPVARVLLAEGDKLVRAALRELLESQSGPAQRLGPSIEAI